MVRVGEAKRRTAETEVGVKINLDGQGSSDVSTGISYFDHMLSTLATHGLFDITVTAKGDLKHHLVEDVALAMGEAMQKALGDRVGIKRFGYALVPMDCSLSSCSVDLVKRPFSCIDLKLEREQVEDMPKEDIVHFIRSLAESIPATMHVAIQYGSNDHHKSESAFKCLAVSLREAVSIDPRRKGAPTSKGVM